MNHAAAAAATTAADFEAARAAFTTGVQAFESGDLVRAEALFLDALRRVPGRPSVLVNLAAVRQRLGRPTEALVSLGEALAAAPDDVAAWFDHGQLLQVLERPQDALSSYERVLALDATHGPAWTQRGSLLKDMGRLAEAATCFKQALAHGGDVELNRYFLASIESTAKNDAGSGDGETPASAPRRYVEALFDSYAEGFDKHLVGTLGYRTPWLIAELLLGTAPPADKRWRHALDLGCGTGLMGPLLAPHCETVDGVDLSTLMLQKAAALGCYRHLRHGEVVEHLQHSTERYQLVVAADVFVYIGDLDGVFAGVARVLDAGGTFAFSVEEAAAPRFELRASSRYAHAEGYLRRLAAAHGFAVQALQRMTLRHEQRQPIGGLLLALSRG
jgi:predicted TPR repeat methyltransferase